MNIWQLAICWYNCGYNQIISTCESSGWIFPLIFSQGELPTGLTHLQYLARCVLAVWGSHIRTRSSTTNSSMEYWTACDTTCKKIKNSSEDWHSTYTYRDRHTEIMTLSLTTQFKNCNYLRVSQNNRNTHAHLCLAPVRRLCARVICGCRWGARGTCYNCCWKLFCVSSIQATIAPPRRRPRPQSYCQRTLSSAHLSELSISECVRLCDAHVAYTCT